jgi:hypothetical protein
MTEGKEIRLREWEEIVGSFQGIEKDDYSISVMLNNFRVTFNAESNEAKIIEESLNSGLIGERIAILRTDSSAKPLLIRIDRGRENSDPPSSSYFDH